MNTEKILCLQCAVQQLMFLVEAETVQSEDNSEKKMDKLPNMMELDDPDPESPEQPSTSHDREDPTTSQNASQEQSLPGTSQASDLGRDLDLLMEEAKKLEAARVLLSNLEQGFKQPQTVEELKRQIDETEKGNRQLEMMMRQQAQEMKQIKKENKELRQKIKESQSSSQATSSGLRTINQQPPGGEMSVERLHESLSGYIPWDTYVITYSFPAGSLN
uniref:uncharacterized protein LOC120339871 n=1 Tax=Styela clava TaxID=7725 RepID=UPI0019395476